MSLILLLSFSGKQFRQLLVPAGHLQYYRAEHKIEQNEKENFILGQTRTKTQFQSMSSINDGWHWEGNTSSVDFGSSLGFDSVSDSVSDSTYLHSLISRSYQTAQ